MSRVKQKSDKRPGPKRLTAKRTPAKRAPAKRPTGKRPIRAPAEPQDAAGPQRLQKVLAAAGIASRRECEQLILEGRVEVDRNVVTKLGTKVDLETQDIRVDGAALKRTKPRYYLVNKPKGFVSTNRDPAGRPRVVDMVPDRSARLFTVGRLDLESEGLILLTNDGELARKLELPSTGWVRTYRALVHGKPDEKKLAQLKNGIEIDGVRYGPINARIERIQIRDAWLTFALTEGKNREIRRVCQHLRLHITKLIRTSYGPFELGDLARGKAEEVPAKVLAKHLNI
jgi:23S rRNA pseudouridine2605 synthase